jgi:hypothetical protein
MIKNSNSRAVGSPLKDCQIWCWKVQIRAISSIEAMNLVVWFILIFIIYNK